MRIKTVLTEYRKRANYIPELGERHTLCDWFQEEDAPMIDMHRYGQLLQLLPDHIVENLEKARLSRDGRYGMIKAGLGYEELLSAVIVDGTAIASSSTEAFLYPALLLPPNYLAPGGIPGRSLHFKARGRHTTLTTGATLNFKWGAALTNVIPTTTWCISGALVMDATIQTATMWFCEGMGTVRSVGSAGTIFAMGDATASAQAFTIANQTNQYMGSAGNATPAAVTVDTTQAQYISLTGKWSLATAYSIQGHLFVVEALN
jgi:hypothetical protein